MKWSKTASSCSLTFPTSPRRAVLHPFTSEATATLIPAPPSHDKAVIQYLCVDDGPHAKVQSPHRCVPLCHLHPHSIATSDCSTFATALFPLMPSLPSRSLPLPLRPYFRFPRHLGTSEPLAPRRLSSLRIGQGLALSSDASELTALWWQKRLSAQCRGGGGSPYVRVSL